MRVLVCGGRHYDDRKKMDRVLRFIDTHKGPIKTLIHGAARGADSLAAAWAKDTGLDEFGEVLAFPADWNKHGVAAGPIRNLEMLLDGKPDLVVAFPGGNGTKNMIHLARKYGVPVQIISAVHADHHPPGE
jgi:YspA, cpYpsA-related SLOG family